MIKYKCPECGATDLCVSCEVAYVLDGNTGDLLKPLSFVEFHDDSAVICNECEHGASAKDFEYVQG